MYPLSHLLTFVVHIRHAIGSITAFSYDHEAESWRVVPMPEKLSVQVTTHTPTASSLVDTPVTQLLRSPASSSLPPSCHVL